MSRAGSSRLPARAGDLDDRLQRMIVENHRLKAELRDRDEKLTRVQTQFRRLSADWKLSVEDRLQPPRPGTSPSASLLPSVAQRGATTAAARAGASPLVFTQQQTQPRPSVSFATATTTTIATTAGGGSGPDAVALANAQDEIARLRSQVLQQQQQQQTLHSQMAPRSSPLKRDGRLPSLPPSPSAAQHQQQQQLMDLSSQMTAERAQHQQDLARTQQQLHQTEAALQQAQAALQQQQQQGSSSAATQQQQQQHMELQYRGALDALARERDGFAMRVQLLEEERKSAAARAAGSSSADPTALVRLQSEVHDRSAQVALLGSRLHTAQAQTEALKAECARLVEELKSAHGAHAEAARQIFALEHERGQLQGRCGRLEDAELTVNRKDEEVLRMEKELLGLMDALRSCNTDTEQAVRREVNARISDLESMRDEADAHRREKERALLQCQSELAEARRRITAVSQDLDVYRVELSKAEREKAEMASRAAFAGHTASEFSDEEVHRAFAIAAMRRRRIEEGGGKRAISGHGVNGGVHREPGVQPAAGNINAVKGSDASAADAVDLYDALNWDDTWEQAQLREALAAAALDMELAEARCGQMAAQVEQARAALLAVSEERDTLLEEGLEMRRRIAQVQTVFAKQQLQAYRAAAASNASAEQNQQQQHGGSISVRVRALHCVSPAMERAVGLARLGDGAAVSLFLTLDGLAEYDTMLSPTLHTLAHQESLDVHFLYDGLDRDEATLASVQGATFVLQLHAAGADIDSDGGEGGGGGTRLVAMTELSGLALLAAREAPIDHTVTLLDGAGAAVGTLLLELCCAGLMLPVLLGRPLADGALLSAAAVKAALVALRAVRFLRVQVFAAHGLPLSAPAGPGSLHDIQVIDGSGGSGGIASASNGGGLAGLPQPYVFYTAQFAGAGGTVSCLADTVVHPASDAFTTDPVFDAAPVDHRVLADRELVRFLAQGSIVFVLFDERATDVRTNLGLIEVPLHPLLASPQAVIRSNDALHPRGTLSFGISWVCGP